MLLWLPAALWSCGGEESPPVICPAVPVPSAQPFVDATAELGIDGSHHFATDFCELTDTIGGPGGPQYPVDDDGYHVTV